MIWRDQWINFPIKRIHLGAKTRAQRVATLLLITVGFASLPSLAANDAVVPCPARADAVIANFGRVVSSKCSPVDSYNSTLGAYGGTNVGNHGTVRAADAIIRRDGLIKGSTIEHSPAGLPEVAVSAIAIPLPLGAKVRGHLDLDRKHESITLRPSDYVPADIDLDWPAAIRVSPAGDVRIFVSGRLGVGGEVEHSFVLSLWTKGRVSWADFRPIRHYRQNSVATL